MPPRSRYPGWPEIPHGVCAHGGQGELGADPSFEHPSTTHRAMRVGLRPVVRTSRHCVSRRPMPTANCQPCVPRFGKSLRGAPCVVQPPETDSSASCRISDSESAITWLFSHPSGSDTARCPLVRPRGRCAASGLYSWSVSIWAYSSSSAAKDEVRPSSRRNVDPTENPLRYQATCFRKSRQPLSSP